MQKYAAASFISPARHLDATLSSSMDLTSCILVINELVDSLQESSILCASSIMTIWSVRFILIWFFMRILNRKFKLNYWISDYRASYSWIDQIVVGTKYDVNVFDELPGAIVRTHALPFEWLNKLFNVPYRLFEAVALINKRFRFEAIVKCAAARVLTARLTLLKFKIGLNTNSHFNRFNKTHRRISEGLVFVQLLAGFIFAGHFRYHRVNASVLSACQYCHSYIWISYCLIQFLNTNFQSWKKHLALLAYEVFLNSLITFAICLWVRVAKKIVGILSNRQFNFVK